MELLFKAFDGTVFNEEEKCKEYEKNLSLLEDVKKEIIFLDYDENIILDPISEVEFNDVKTIVVGNDKAANFLDELLDEEGFYVPNGGFLPYSVYSWESNEFEDTWVNAEEMAEELKDKLEYFESKVKLLDKFLKKE